MLHLDSTLDHYILELPYEAMDGEHSPLCINKSDLYKKGSSLEQELDLFYNDGTNPLCFEFKFHRNPEGKNDYAHTDAAGSIFNDIYRLGVIHSNKYAVRRFLIYVTDDEMHNYFTMASPVYKNVNFRNCLKQFYNLPTGSSYCGQIIGPTTFKGSATKSLHSIPPVSVVKFFNADLNNVTCSSLKTPGGCHIRGYEVLPDSTISITNGHSHENAPYLD